MCIMNTGKQERNIYLKNFTERTQGFVGGKDIINGIQLSSQFSIPSMTMQVIELTK